MTIPVGHSATIGMPPVGKSGEGDTLARGAAAQRQSGLWSSDFMQPEQPRWRTELELCRCESLDDHWPTALGTAPQRVSSWSGLGFGPIYAAIQIIASRDSGFFVLGEPYRVVSRTAAALSHATCESGKSSRAPLKIFAGFALQAGRSGQGISAQDWRYKRLLPRGYNFLIHRDVPQVVPAVTLKSGNRQSYRCRTRTRVEQSNTESILPGFKFPGNGHGVLIHRIAGKPLPDVGIERHDCVSDF